MTELAFGFSSILAFFVDGTEGVVAEGLTILKFSPYAVVDTMLFLAGVAVPVFDLFLVASTLGVLENVGVGLDLGV